VRVLVADPGGEQARSLPVLLAGTEAQKQQWLGPLAAGQALFCYALSEADAARMRRRCALERSGTATGGCLTV